MTRKRRSPLVALAFLGSVIVSQSPALADVAEMRLTNPPPGDVLYSVYISPYTATINGVSQLVICDDFLDDTYTGETWQANVINGSADLSTTRMATLSGRTGDDLNRAYDAIAWLGLRLLAPGVSVTDRGYLSFAIWDIFADTGSTQKPLAKSVPQWVGVNSSFYLGHVRPLALEALAEAPKGERARLTIYSPASDGTCGTAPCPTQPSQEFVTVTTPEASAPAILALDLLTLLGVVFLVRRRVLRNAEALR